DLGFSSFTHSDPSSNLPPRQFTIVDCPGHTSLIRQVMSASTIVDSVILVVSAVSSVQLQTVECCVIGDAVLEKRKEQSIEDRGSGVIVITKVDLIEGGITGSKYKSVVSDIKNLTLHTNFESCPILPCQVSPSLSSTSWRTAILTSISQSIGNPIRTLSPTENFYFQIDHCFTVKGQGTILTGTVLTGSIKVNDLIELPSLGKVVKVKGIQSFQTSVEFIKKGDRAGICVAGLDAKNLERTVAVTPKSLKSLKAGIFQIKRVRMFEKVLKSGGKFHMSLGNETVMGVCTFFGSHEIHNGELNEKDLLDKDYLTQSMYIDDYDTRDDDSIDPMRYKTTKIEEQYCYIRFERSVWAPEGCQVIGSRLDSDFECRLAFTGQILVEGEVEERLRFYTEKEKTCYCSKLDTKYIRSSDSAQLYFSVICRDLFGKGAQMNSFKGLKVTTINGEIGSITEAFGTEGKFRVEFPKGLDVEPTVGEEMFLKFRKVRGDKTNKMWQDHIILPEKVNRKIIVSESDLVIVAPHLPKPPEKKKPLKPFPHIEESKTDKLTGKVDKIKENNIYIVSGLFLPETDVKLHIGDSVIVKGKDLSGQIIAAFGKAGKCKVEISGDVGLGDKIETV
ncbi:hypothetical protein TL16_g00415, partial [Triparma laevis f. inornata]